MPQVKKSSACLTNEEELQAGKLGVKVLIYRQRHRLDLWTGKPLELDGEDRWKRLYEAIKRHRDKSGFDPDTNKLVVGETAEEWLARRFAPIYIEAGLESSE